MTIRLQLADMPEADPLGRAAFETHGMQWAAIWIAMDRIGMPDLGYSAGVREVTNSLSALDRFGPERAAEVARDAGVRPSLWTGYVAFLRLAAQYGGVRVA